MNNNFIIISSNHFGDFSENLPESLIQYRMTILPAIESLKLEDNKRCSLSGIYRCAFTQTEFGLWVVMVFLADKPNGGASLLMGNGFKEVVSTFKEVVSTIQMFDFNIKEDPCAEQLFEIVLYDSFVHEKIYKEMSGEVPPNML